MGIQSTIISVAYGISSVGVLYTAKQGISYNFAKVPSFGLALDAARRKWHRCSREEKDNKREREKTGKETQKGRTNPGQWLIAAVN